MENQSSSFLYQPLEHHDSIRLLRLEPAADHNAMLKGSLVHTTISERYHDLVEPYTALSYVWGDATDNAGLIQLGDGTMNPTATLEAALRDLRHRNVVRFVWADALCIDQSNVDERSTQVSMMDKIYSSANHTVIYLGRSNAAIDQVFDLYKHSEGTSAALGPSYEAPKAKAQESLMSRPWFGRAWVLQELILSPDPWVQCGPNARVRWATFCRICGQNLVADTMLLPKRKTERAHVWPQDTASNSGINGYYDVSRIGYKVASVLFRMPLWELLDSRRGIGATDPRDIVFAHLNVASDEDQFSRFITVDYSMSVDHVYNQVTRYIVQVRGIAYLFRQCFKWQHSGQFPGLDPWVLDWTSTTKVPRLSSKDDNGWLDLVQDLEQAPVLRTTLCSSGGLSMSMYGPKPSSIAQISHPLPQWDSWNDRRAEEITELVQEAVAGIEEWNDRRSSESLRQSAEYLLKGLSKLLEVSMAARSKTSEPTTRVTRDPDIPVLRPGDAGRCRVGEPLYERPLRSVHRTLVNKFKTGPEKGYSLNKALQHAYELQLSNQVDMLMDFFKSQRGNDRWRRRIALTTDGKFLIVPLAARPGDLLVPLSKDASILLRPMAPVEAVNSFAGSIDAKFCQDPSHKHNFFGTNPPGYSNPDRFAVVGGSRRRVLHGEGKEWWHQLPSTKLPLAPDRSGHSAETDSDSDHEGREHWDIYISTPRQHIA